MHFADAFDLGGARGGRLQRRPAVLAKGIARAGALGGRGFAGGGGAEARLIEEEATDEGELADRGRKKEAHGRGIVDGDGLPRLLAIRRPSIFIRQVQHRCAGPRVRPRKSEASSYAQDMARATCELKPKAIAAMWAICALAIRWVEKRTIPVHRMRHVNRKRSGAHERA